MASRSIDLISKTRKNLHVQYTFFSKGRTIRKVMGVGGGEKPKKNACKGKCQEKKIYAKKKVKKKIHAKGRSNCDFFKKTEFQESTILLRTI